MMSGSRSAAEPGVRKARLETESIVIGYVMSRVDARYLSTFGCSTWHEAFGQAAKALGVPPASLKNLRDEFDPFHANGRVGWHKRPLRIGRHRVLSELQEVSEDAVLELAARILKRDTEVTDEAIDALAAVTHVAHNVAERLLTGRRAEEHFLANTTSIVDVPRSEIVDCRQSALGFDFGVRGVPDLAIEVKGIKRSRGAVLFTDREWSEAKRRAENYWLVIVGDLATAPRARVVRNPHLVLPAACQYQRAVCVVWNSRVAI